MPELWSVRSQRRARAVPSLSCRQTTGPQDLINIPRAPQPQVPAQSFKQLPWRKLCLKQDSRGLTTCACYSLCLHLLGNVCTWSRGYPGTAGYHPQGRRLRQGKRQTSVSLPDGNMEHGQQASSTLVPTGRSEAGSSLGRNRPQPWGLTRQGE